MSLKRSSALTNQKWRQLLALSAMENKLKANPHLAARAYHFLHPEIKARNNAIQYAKKKVANKKLANTQKGKGHRMRKNRTRRMHFTRR